MNRTFMKLFHPTKSIVAAAFAVFVALFAPAVRAQTPVTIASVYSGGAGMYTLDGTVTEIIDTFSTNNSFLVSDGTGSIFAYHVSTANYTPTVGDNITFTTTNSPYSGAPELTNTGFTLLSTNSTGNAVAPMSLTIPQFVSAGGGSTSSGGTGTANPPYAEALVTLNNVFLPANTTSLATKTSYTLTDAANNTTTMYTYTTDSAVAAAVTAANNQETSSGNTLYAGAVNITGYADVFYGVTEIYPVSIVAAVPEPRTSALFGLCVLPFLAGAYARRVRRRG